MYICIANGYPITLTLQLNLDCLSCYGYDVLFFFIFCNSSTCCIYLLLCGFRTTDIIRDPAPVLDYHSSPSHSHLARTNSFSTTRSTSHTSLLEREHRALAPEYRPMTQIEELKESSRPGTRHGGEPQSWAVTHLGMKENTVNKSKFIYLSSFCSAKLRSALPMISDAKFFFRCSD